MGADLGATPAEGASARIKTDLTPVPEERACRAAVHAGGIIALAAKERLFGIPERIAK
jgi:hypothetical protein